MGRPRKNGFRVAHGAAKAGGALTASEPVPFDELPTAKGAPAAGPQRDANGRFTAGNTVAALKRHRVGKHGALAKLEAQADPSWHSANRWGQDWLRHRLREYAAAHGDISSGVGAILATAAATMADSRWLRAMAAAKGDADLAKTAAQLARQATAAERDAWALASLEAQAREADDGDALAQRQRAFQKQLAEQNGGQS